MLHLKKIFSVALSIVLHLDEKCLHLSSIVSLLTTDLQVR